jgi:hypothetical protein
LVELLQADEHVVEVDEQRAAQAAGVVGSEVAAGHAPILPGSPTAGAGIGAPA